MIVDRSNAQAAQRKPPETCPACRHGFCDNGFRDPVEFHPGPAAAREEVAVTAAQEIKVKIKQGIRESRKDRPCDQTIATTVNHRNWTTRVVSRTKGRMVAKSTLRLVLEIRQYRPPDHIGPSS